MKQIVLVLLLANLALLLWNLTRQDPVAEAPAPPPLPADVAPLVLLTEQAAPVSPPTGPQPAPPVAEIRRQAPAPVAPSTPPPVAADQKTPAPPPAPVCRSAGPFDSEAAAGAVADVLLARGLTPLGRESEVDGPTGYLVMLTPPSKEAAEAIAAQLETQGVEDYFIGKGFAVVLGMYATEATAAVRQASLKALGYAPRIEPRPTTLTQYWLDLRSPAETSLSAEEWAELLRDHPGSRLQPQPCQ